MCVTLKQYSGDAIIIHYSVATILENKLYTKKSKLITSHAKCMGLILCAVKRLENKYIWHWALQSHWNWKMEKKLMQANKPCIQFYTPHFFKRVQVINFGEIAPKNSTQGMWVFDKTVKRSHSFFFCPANNVINCTMYTVADFIIFLPLRLRLKEKTWETCSAAAL